MMSKKTSLILDHETVRRAVEALFNEGITNKIRDSQYVEKVHFNSYTKKFEVSVENYFDRRTRLAKKEKKK